MNPEHHLHSGHEAIRLGAANACPTCQAFEIEQLKAERDKLRAALEAIRPSIAFLQQEGMIETKIAKQFLESLQNEHHLPPA